MHEFSVVSLALGICTLGSVIAMGGEKPGEQCEATLCRKVEARLNYLLYLPKDYEQQESWPLLMFLHGVGERGNNLELVKKHGPPKLIAAGKEFPFIVISPQCPDTQWWEPVSLTALLDEVTEKYKVDADRVYVTGLSMGGFGTWRLAAYTPERLAAIVPICGGGEKFWTKSFPRLPVWAFHGDQDGAVPLNRSQIMVDELRVNGGSPKLTIYPGVGHDSWTQTYENPEVYEWLLKHKRGKQE